MFRAHIERTQMTQTFQGPQPLPDTVIFFLWQELQSCCLFLCSCFVTLLMVACQVLLPRSGASGILDWQPSVMYLPFKYLYYLSSFLIQNRPVLLLLLRLLHFSFSLPVSSYNTSSSILHFLYLRML